MKRLLQCIQTVGFLASAALLGITIFARSEIREMAREFINERIEPKATGAVGFAEEGMRSPRLREYLSEEQVFVIESELALYREDPQTYIRKLTNDEFSAEDPSVSETKIPNPIVASIAAKVISWKSSVNRYFNEVFDRIIRDLRIFSITNIAAFALAYWFSTRRGMIDFVPYRIASTILTISIVYSCVMYVDRNWFFTILLNSFMGFAYPVGIAGLFAFLIFKYSEMRANWRR